MTDLMNVYPSFSTHTRIVTIRKELSSENVQIDAWATFMSLDVYDVISQEVNVCDGLSSSNDDGSCPSVGTYYISETIKVPEEVASFSSLLNLIGIAVYAYDSDSGDKLGCFKASLSLSTSSSSSSAYSSSARMTASVAFLGAVLFSVFFVRMNKRRTAVIDIDDSDLVDGGDGGGHNFKIFDGGVRV